MFYTTSGHLFFVFIVRPSGGVRDGLCFQGRTGNSRVIMLYTILYIRTVEREKRGRNFFCRHFQSHIKVNFNEDKLLKSAF